ncbi:MAG: FAD:protein FMN transferase [Acidobacteriota bacterium]|nr:FAD:protein FMN transferase [Acidobacteriota bacterium]
MPAAVLQRLLATAFLCGASSLPALAVPDLIPVRRQVVVMGTLCTLNVFASDRASGIDRCEGYLRLLEETNRQLSTWETESELSRLNRHPIGVPYPVTPSLCRLYGELIQWNQWTDSAFDPAIGALANAYRSLSTDRSGFQERLERARRSSGMRHLEFRRDDCSVVRRAGVLLDPGAFGKGEALDRVRRLAGSRGDPPWLIDLGGQIMTWGTPPGQTGWQVEIADPHRRKEGALSVRVIGGSLATSGGSERDTRAGDRRVAHILDPRTGTGAPFQGSVAVWHRRALVADILSTALYVMGPESGLAWAETRDLAACFLDRPQVDGERTKLRVRATRAFRQRFSEMRIMESPASAGRSPGSRPSPRHEP